MVAQNIIRQEAFDERVIVKLRISLRLNGHGKIESRVRHNTLYIAATKFLEIPPIRELDNKEGGRQMCDFLYFRESASCVAWHVAPVRDDRDRLVFGD